MAIAERSDLIECLYCGSKFAIYEANLKNPFQSHIHCPVCGKPIYRLGAVPILESQHNKL